MSLPLELTSKTPKRIVTEYEQGVYAPTLTVSANTTTVSAGICETWQRLGGEDKLLCRVAGGRVSVQSVTEGGLCVVSKAGPVKLGKIKATTAHVDTSGKPALVDPLA